MHSAMQEAASRGVFFGFPAVQQYLILEVRRDNLVNDTINELSKCASADLKKPLKVNLFTFQNLNCRIVLPKYFQFRSNFMARKLRTLVECGKNFSCCC